MKTKQIIGKIRAASNEDVNNGGIFFNGELLFQCDVNNDLDLMVFDDSVSKLKMNLTYSEKQALKKAIKWEVTKNGNIVTLKMKYMNDDEPNVKTIEFINFGNKFTTL